MYDQLRTLVLQAINSLWLSEWVQLKWVRQGKCVHMGYLFYIIDFLFPLVGRKWILSNRAAAHCYSKYLHWIILYELFAAKDLGEVQRVSVAKALRWLLTRQICTPVNSSHALLKPTALKWKSLMKPVMGGTANYGPAETRSAKAAMPCPWTASHDYWRCFT